MPALLEVSRLLLVAAIAWVVRELVIRQGAEETQRARSLLQARLEKAYGPIFYLVGELLRESDLGASVANSRREELRVLLRDHGHHLRDEHYLFCVGVAGGSKPAPGRAIWHRLSMQTEIEKLRFLLYGSATAAEDALSARPVIMMWRLFSRSVRFVVALGFWVALLVGLAWLVLHRGERTLVTYWPLGAIVLVLWLIREVAGIVRVRHKFSSTVLRAVKLGDRGKSVALVQVLLQLCGQDLGDAGADGVFGPDTEAAIRGFQRACGLKLTGKLDKPTRIRLSGVALKE
jgi:hypothetical protein